MNVNREYTYDLSKRFVSTDVPIKDLKALEAHLAAHETERITLATVLEVATLKEGYSVEDVAACFFQGVRR